MDRYPAALNIGAGASIPLPGGGGFSLSVGGSPDPNAANAAAQAEAEQKSKRSLLQKAMAPENLPITIGATVVALGLAVAVLR